MLNKLAIQDKVKDDVRVDPRVKRTLQLLQKAFDDLLEEKGFPNITVNDIAERANINRATFYLHFEDKYALLRYTLRESFTRMLEQSPLDEPAFSINNLHMLTTTLCEFMSKFYERCHPEARNEEMIIILAQLQQHVYELLLKWITSSVYSPRRGTQPKMHEETASDLPSVEYRASALSWLVFGTAMQAQITQTKQPPEQWAQQMLALVTPGLRIYLEPLAER
jgi:AcrR family transcriptional regulator